MTLAIVGAGQSSAEDLAACFTEAFDGYLAGSFAMTAQALPLRLARWGAELSMSRCAVVDGALAGFVFVGRHGRRRRVGAMGVCPAARGSGASRALLGTVVDEARAAGAQALELEVFAQNVPALKLYRSFGFVDGAPLWGFVREPAPVDATPATPRAMALAHAADWLQAHGPAQLPYQQGGESMRHVDAAATSWQLGTALIVFQASQQVGVTVLALVDADPAQRDARRLIDALLVAHPAQTVRVPQLMHDDIAARALREAGFTALPLHQIQMRLDLRGCPPANPA
ncbi:GNAT family N-acetyltransferase [Piscinibacter sp. XHJ-5]|uniref:GNAT family N-acetyltransferase n=1 Tax=Piscinibacter sp. XHJ-5 TaxID=3037797 RepID=UPI0024529C23|nr:GNAT family N-acetyltransferase [Piscinibacter sp. XHJ-5]